MNAPEVDIEFENPCQCGSKTFVGPEYLQPNKVMPSKNPSRKHYVKCKSCGAPGVAEYCYVNVDEIKRVYGESMLSGDDHATALMKAEQAMKFMQKPEAPCSANSSKP